MLRELQVKNFALIDDASIKFGEGLNILSGETGAGKTLIIEAINLLIGERAENDFIREGQEKLLVQGYFDFSSETAVLKYLQEKNFIDEEDAGTEVIITREVSRVGKNKAFINGIFTQVSMLKELGKYFIDMHGQHDHQFLLEPMMHIKIVDEFGGDKFDIAKNEYRETLKDFIFIKNDLKKLLSDREKKEGKINDLTFRLKEIKDLKIKTGEEDSIENELRVLKNREKVFNLAAEAAVKIKPDNPDSVSLSDDISELCRCLSELAKIDNNFEKYSEEAVSLAGLIDDLSHFISSYVEGFDFSPERLDQLQARAYAISEIKKKYNMELEEIAELAEKIEQEIKVLENLDLEIENAENKLRKAEEKLLEKALNLSNLRKESILKLKELVMLELKSLKFNSVSFVPEQRILESEDGLDYEGKKIKVTSEGIDEIEFYISLNVGEREKPLRKVASGGEISRIMLAIKSAISFIKNTSIMIFDEIDSGIGGSASFVVGEKLYKIAQSCQVIVITHQAQIACFSDFHLFIEKYVSDNKTIIGIRHLEEAERVGEIARMLSGSKQSNISQLHAEELLEKCSNIKKIASKGMAHV